MAGAQGAEREPSRRRQGFARGRRRRRRAAGQDPSASTETRVLGLKGDALNLNTNEVVTSNPDDRTTWDVGKGEKVAGGKSDKLSEIGHGQVPFMGSEAPAAAVSFARVTQQADRVVRSAPARHSRERSAAGGAQSWRRRGLISLRDFPSAGP